MNRNRQKIPVLSFAGYSNQGKTTFIEKVIREYAGRGLRIAYVKHAHRHDIFAPASLTRSGKKKDSERMLDAGCVLSIAVSNQGALICDRRAIGGHESEDSMRRSVIDEAEDDSADQEKETPERKVKRLQKPEASDIYEIVDEITDVDLILIEGYKAEAFPKVLVTMDREKSAWPVREEEVLCVVSDVSPETACRVFTREESAPFCDYYPDVRKEAEPEQVAQESV